MATESGFLLANSWLFFPIGVFVAMRVTVSLIISLIYLWNTYVKLLFLPRENIKKKYGPWAGKID